MIDANAAEMMISTIVEAISAERPAGAAARFRLDERNREAKELGRKQDRDRQFEQLQRALIVEARPGRKQGEVLGEIFGPNVMGLKHQHDADQQLRHPQRRGEIAHDAVGEMLSCRQCEATGADDARVLQIALAPSTVAGREIDERGRALFVGAAEAGQHVDGVSGAKHEPRLDEIVAENVAAERWSARQVRQAAMIGERARADDRIVAPVVAVASHPGAQARGHDRAG